MKNQKLHIFEIVSAHKIKLILIFILFLQLAFHLSAAYNTRYSAFPDEWEIVKKALHSPADYNDYKYGKFIGFFYSIPLRAGMYLKGLDSSKIDWDFPVILGDIYQVPHYLFLLRIARLVNLFFSLLICVLTYFIAKMFMPPIWATLSVALLVVSPVFWCYSNLVKSESLTTFLALTCTLLVIRKVTSEREGRRNVFAATFFSALSFGIKYNFMTLAPIVMSLFKNPYFSKKKLSTLVFAMILWGIVVLAIFNGVAYFVKTMEILNHQYLFRLPTGFKIVPHVPRYTYLFHTLILMLPFCIGLVLAPFALLGLLSFLLSDSCIKKIFIAFPLCHLLFFEIIPIRIWNNYLPVTPYLIITATYVIFICYQKGSKILGAGLLTAALVMGFFWGHSRIYQIYLDMHQSMQATRVVINKDFNAQSVLDGRLSFFFPGFEAMEGLQWLNDPIQLKDKLENTSPEWIVAGSCYFDNYKKFGGEFCTWVGEFPERVMKEQTQYTGISIQWDYPMRSFFAMIDPEYDFGFYIFRRKDYNAKMLWNNDNLLIRMNAFLKQEGCSISAYVQ